jgi:3-mercaptopyruvate sulfurtransferase SseA
MKASNIFRFALEYGRRHRDLPTITPEEVHPNLGRPGFYVYDCNIESLWARAHIPEAIYIGFDKFSVDVLPADKSATLVFYCACHLCLASHMAARRAQVFGYKSVFVMTAGVIGWKSKGFPLVGNMGSLASVT